MRINYEKVLVVDLEATAWESKEEAARNTSEIIEIGVALLNLNTWKIEKSQGILIKPEVSKVSEFCTKLTTITQDQLDKDGVYFTKACDILKRHYGSESLPWVSYGSYDRDMFARQCSRVGIKNPLSKEHLNVKLLASLLTDKHKRCGMDEMLSELGLTLEGTHHRGVDDAINIAKIFTKLAGK